MDIILFLTAVSTFVFMKVLESSPSRYDRGIKYLTFGQITTIYDRLVGHIHKGDQVLDLGCGTGRLSLLAAQKGATVKGIDINPDMLEIARKRRDEAGLGEQVQFEEKGVAELDTEQGPFDVIIGGMLFSELQAYERHFTIDQILRLLKPGGHLLLADETIPPHPLKRLLSWIVRFPLVLVTYILTQTTTSAVGNIFELVEKTGLKIIHKDYYMLDSFITIVGRKE